MTSAPPSRRRLLAHVGLATFCLMLSPVGIASADTLVDTGSAWYDNQGYASGYLAFGFTASGAAQIDGFSMLASATSAAVTGSSIDIYANYPTAPTTPADLLGTLTYASIANEASRQRVTFTGSVNIPSAGDYWVKWRGLPDSSNVWILFGAPGTPAPWTFKAGPWYRDGTLQTDLPSTYIPKFRITGGAVVAPVISTVSPAAGPAAGGTSVAITGTGLSGATGVYFGGTAATSFTVNSPTQITAVTPARTAGTVDVSVTTGGGTSSLGTAFTFEAAATGGGDAPVADPARPTEVETPTPARAAERARMSSVERLTAKPGQRPGIKTFAANVRTVQGGRYTILFENKLGQRVPLQRGSRVGSRTLRGLIYAVVVNAGAGESLTVSAALREAAAAGLRLRVIHRDVNGTLSGEEATTG